MGEINVGGIVALVIFYLLILGIGLFAAWKRKRNAKNATTVIEETNEVILAGRSIGGIIGCFTMTGILVFLFNVHTHAYYTEHSRSSAMFYKTEMCKIEIISDIPNKQQLRKL